MARFKFLLFFAIIFLIFSFIDRVILGVIAVDSILLSHLISIFLIGLINDIITFTYLLIPFVIYLSILPNIIFYSKFHLYLSYLFFFFVYYSLGFNLVSEYLFWDEFGVRFNFIAVDYLLYTHEVINNIKESYPVLVIFLSIGAVSLIFTYFSKNSIKRLHNER